MEEYLPFVSIDTWTMIFTWVNTLILFLLLKKFLFKPVNKVIDDRAAEIENTYGEAERIKDEARGIKDEYEQKLMSASREADQIVKSAVAAASERSEAIVHEAQIEAERAQEKSRKRIEQEKTNAVNEAKADIAKMAVDAAEKIIRRELNEKSGEKMISDIIDEL